MDVLEHAVVQLRVLVGDRQRADHRVVEVAPARLEDLPGRDRQQRGDDRFGDRGRLGAEVRVAVHSQRGHPEQRVA